MLPPISGRIDIAYTSTRPCRATSTALYLLGWAIAERHSGHVLVKTRCARRLFFAISHSSVAIRLFFDSVRPSVDSPLPRLFLCRMKRGRRITGEKSVTTQPLRSGRNVSAKHCVQKGSFKNKLNHRISSIFVFQTFKI